MLYKAQQYFSKIKPVTIDGALYVLIALFGAMTATFSSDEAYKYVNPHFKYWAQHVVGWALAVVGSLKMFRSTSYSEHLDEKNLAKTVSSSKITESVGGTIATETKTLEQK